jgi:hypothetical protein
MWYSQLFYMDPVKKPHQRLTNKGKHYCNQNPGNYVGEAPDHISEDQEDKNVPGVFQNLFHK